MEGGEREAVLTWPEGNAWLTQRLAARRWATACTRGAWCCGWRKPDQVCRPRCGDASTQTLERWHAHQAVVALPLHVAARVVQAPPAFLLQAANALVHAPWLVANLQLDAPLRDRAGAAPSWDNVVYGAAGLGYVDAMHQSLRSTDGPTVLTHYRTLMVPGFPAQLSARQARQHLLDAPWQHWRDTVLG